MDKNIRMTRDYLCVVMSSMISILVYIYFSEIFLKSTGDVLGAAILIIVGITDYLTKKYITNALVFFGLRLLWFIPVILFTDVPVIAAMIVGVFYVLGITFWKTDAGEVASNVFDIPTESVALFIGAYIHATISLSHATMTYAYLGGIMFILLSFLRKYLDKFIQISMSKSDNPALLNKTFKMNSSFMVVFFAALILSALLIGTLFGQDNFEFIGRFLKWIASLFFSLFAVFTGKEAPVNNEYHAPDVQEPSSGIAINPEHSATTMESPFWDAVSKILEVAIFVAIAAVILFLIFRFFKYYMHRNRETTDEITAIEKPEKIVKEKSEKPKREFHLFLTNKEKIRKYYRTSVASRAKKNEKIHLRTSETPVEITEHVLKYEPGSNEKLLALTDLYEKARYSNEEISDSEADYGKSLTTG